MKMMPSHAPPGSRGFVISIAKGLLALALVLVLAMLAVVLGRPTVLGLFIHPPTSELKQDYDKIEIGMTLSEVEALIGRPGKELKQEGVTRQRNDRAVVEGDRFYKWTGPINGQEIILGVRDARVCDKWYGEYSL
jgi:hypothetical protein